MHKNDNRVLLEVRGITKRFPGTLALDDVQLTVKKGEVHALMGENGAGKSTLMKIVAGQYIPDGGTVFWEGKRISFENPADALAAGVSMIYQELNPILHMSISENLFLHREPLSFGGLFLDRKEMNSMATDILNQYGLRLNPKTKMASLTLAQMQMVEIIRAVTFNSRLVIMDEPTSSLDSDESENLFETIKELKSKGISIIYISHRMDEIQQVCDTVTVFRDGKYIGTKDVENITREELIKMMVGRTLSDMFEKKPAPVGNEVLRVEGLTRKGLFEDISFNVRKGEVLGFSGLVGAGRSEIMKAIFGLDPIDSGAIYWDGEEINISTTREAIDRGIAMVTEDRKMYGLVLCRSLYENVCLPNLKNQQSGLFIKHKSFRKKVSRHIKKLAIKTPGLHTATLNLSGGNQQKVILAKWIMAAPKLLILDEPTRGIDIGAKHEIYKLICQFAEEGMAIILVSSEMEEIIGMSDRVLVIHEGRLSGEFDRADLLKSGAQEKILSRALGV